VTLKILDLFSGLGGFSLGLERTGHFKTIAFCDNNKYCNLVLQKHWKGVKIYNDVREISKEKFKEDGIEFPDIITGGFPCQPFSVAGKQKGTSDDRHLWPEMFRIIKAFKPRFVIGENVPGIVNIQDGVVFETVCTDLESQGYEVQPFNIPAAAVGAPHQRKRIWIIATLADSVSNDERSPEAMKKREEYRKSIGRKTVPPGSLAEQVKYGKATTDMRMWPTPRTGGGSRPNQKGGKVLNEEVLIAEGLRERGKTLAEQVKYETATTDMKKPKVMWPSPRACDLEGGVVKNVELRNMSFSRVNKKGVRFGVKLKDAVHKVEQMMPTPTARDWKDSGPNTNYETARKKSRLAGTAGGTLNPTWVEWLMGYKAGYTDLKDWAILSSRKSSKK